MTSNKPPANLSPGDTAQAPVGALETLTLAEGFEVTVNGATVKGKPKFETWDETLRTLRLVEKASPFAIGDLLNKAEEVFGEKASQLTDFTEWSEKTVSVYRWIAGRVAADIRRMDRLTISHHMAVARLPPSKQKAWLDKAADAEEPWSVGKLKADIKANGDEVEVTYWVLVACTSEADQTDFKGQMELAGRTVKAVEKRGQKRETGHERDGAADSGRGEQNEKAKEPQQGPRLVGRKRGQAEAHPQGEGPERAEGQEGAEAEGHRYPARRKRSERRAPKVAEAGGGAPVERVEPGAGHETAH